MSDVPPQPPQYPQQPQQPQYPQQPPGAPPPQYQPPPGATPYQQPMPAPGQFQPVNPQAKSNNGCLKAFLIVLAISVVLGIGGVIVIVIAADSAVDNLQKSFGTADPKDYAITLDSCEIDESLNQVTAEGSIQNNSGHTQAFNVTIQYIGSDNTKLGSDSLIYTGALENGQKYKIKSTYYGGTTLPKSVDCKQGEVTYWPS